MYEWRMTVCDLVCLHLSLDLARLHARYDRYLCYSDSRPFLHCFHLYRYRITGLLSYEREYGFDRDR